MPDQQIKGYSTDRNMAVSGQDHNICYEAPKTEIMKNSLKSRSGEIRTRLGNIGQRSGRLGIDQ